MNSVIEEFHPEDIKAAIRKRYRTIGAFERAENLAVSAVSDILRGKRSARTERAIRRVLFDDAKWGVQKSIESGRSTAGDESHRQNAGAA